MRATPLRPSPTGGSTCAQRAHCIASGSTRNTEAHGMARKVSGHFRCDADGFDFLGRNGCSLAFRTGWQLGAGFTRQVVLGSDNLSAGLGLELAPGISRDRVAFLRG